MPLRDLGGCGWAYLLPLRDLSGCGWAYLLPLRDLGGCEWAYLLPLRDLGGCGWAYLLPLRDLGVSSLFPRPALSFAAKTAKKKRFSRSPMATHDFEGDARASFLNALDPRQRNISAPNHPAKNTRSAPTKHLSPESREMFQNW